MFRAEFAVPGFHFFSSRTCWLGMSFRWYRVFSAAENPGKSQTSSRVIHLRAANNHFQESQD